MVSSIAQQRRLWGGRSSHPTPDRPQRQATFVSILSFLFFFQLFSSSLPRPLCAFPAVLMEGFVRTAHARSTHPVCSPLTRTSQPEVEFWLTPRCCFYGESDRHGTTLASELLKWKNIKVSLHKVLALDIVESNKGHGWLCWISYHVIMHYNSPEIKWSSNNH